MQLLIDCSCAIVMFIFFTNKEIRLRLSLKTRSKTTYESLFLKNTLIVGCVCVRCVCVCVCVCVCLCVCVCV